MSSSWGAASNPPGVGGPNRAAVTSGTPCAPCHATEGSCHLPTHPRTSRLTCRSGQQNRQVDLDKKYKQKGGADVGLADRFLTTVAQKKQPAECQPAAQQEPGKKVLRAPWTTYALRGQV